MTKEINIINKLFAKDLRNGVKMSLIKTVKNGAMTSNVIIKIRNESKLGIKSNINLVFLCISLLIAGFSRLSIILKTVSEKNCNKIMAKTKDSEGTKPK